MGFFSPFDGFPIVGSSWGLPSAFLPLFVLYVSEEEVHSNRKVNPNHNAAQWGGLPRHPAPNKITLQKILSLSNILLYSLEFFSASFYTRGKKEQNSASHSSVLNVKFVYVIHTLHIDIFHFQTSLPALLTDEQLIWLKILQLLPQLQ